MSDDLNLESIRSLSDQELLDLLSPEAREALGQKMRDKTESEPEPSEIKSTDNKGEAAADNVSNETDLSGISSETKNDPNSASVTETDPTCESKGVNKKFKKKIVIIACAAVALAIAVAIFLLSDSELEKVKSEALNIVGRIGSGNNYFTIDTYPDEYENMDSEVVALLLPSHQEKALKAIRYANEALGFTGAVYSDMLNTNALMGRQSEENSKYKITWTYHPDDGLEVTYQKK